MNERTYRIRKDDNIPHDSRFAPRSEFYVWLCFRKDDVIMLLQSLGITLIIVLYALPLQLWYNLLNRIDGGG